MLRIIRPRDIESVTGLRQTRIRELEARGEFPQRVRISDRAVGWRSDEVEAWIESRPRAEDVPADTGARNGIGTKYTGAVTATAAARAEREAT
jgi:prophage regulatory protein